MADAKSSSPPQLLPPFAALRAFEAFGRIGGVRRTAQHLGVSHAIVSRHLRTLESWLSVQLIDRDHHVLTPAGQRYHAQLGHAFAVMHEATNAIRRQEADRMILWCAPGLAYLWLTRRLGGFEPFGGGALDLKPTETMAVFGQDDADAEIRYVADRAQSAPDAHVRQAEMARPFVFPVASPALAGVEGGMIEDARALLSLPLLHEQDDQEWSTWLALQGVEAPHPPQAARLWQAHMVLAGAREGRGVALSNAILAADDLASGRVVRLTARSAPLRDVALGAYVLRAHAQHWHNRPMRGLARWLRTEFLKEVTAKPAG